MRIPAFKNTVVWYVITVLTAVGLHSAARAAEPAGPTELKAAHRAGYTFLTFREDAAVTGERYRVYRSAAPITAAALTEDNCIAVLLEDSATLRDFKGHPEVDRKRRTGERRAMVQDVDRGGRELPKGTGLLVWTCRTGGKAYYAVTEVVDGREHTVVKAGVNVLLKPIAEAKPQAPLAIKMHDYGFGKPGSGVFLFPMDYRRWNPDKIDDNPEGYLRVVNVMIPRDEKLRTAPVPVRVQPHGYGAQNITFDYAIIPGYGDSTREIIVGIRSNLNDWFFGYADSLKAGARRPPHPPAGATVHPYTESLIMHVRRWLLSKPHNCPATADVNRFYCSGGSMGGTAGTLTIARHGDAFAAASCGKAITHWTDPTAWRPEYTGTNWPRQSQMLYGKWTNDPRLPDGRRVYDVLNVIDLLKSHPEYDAPFMALAQSISDSVIEWKTFPAYLRALEAGKHPFAACWRAASHLSGGYPTGSPMAPGAERILVSTPLNQVQLAFANCPDNDDPGQGRRGVGFASPADIKSDSVTVRGRPGFDFPKDFVGLSGYLAGKPIGKVTRVRGRTFWVDGKPLRDTGIDAGGKRPVLWLIVDAPLQGNYNSFFEWHVNGHHEIRGAAATVDQPKRLEIQLRVKQGPGARPIITFTRTTADVTPRRCQQFKPAPGKQIAWENISYADPARPRTVAKGTVKADKHGLVTLEKLQINKGGLGSRLVLTIP